MDFYPDSEDRCDPCLPEENAEMQPRRIVRRRRSRPPPTPDVGRSSLARTGEDQREKEKETGASVADRCMDSAAPIQLLNGSTICLIGSAPRLFKFYTHTKVKSTLKVLLLERVRALGGRKKWVTLNKTQIAKDYCVGRSAIYKALNELCEEDYLEASEFDAANNYDERCYRIAKLPDGMQPSSAEWCYVTTYDLEAFDGDVMMAVIATKFFNDWEWFRTMAKTRWEKLGKVIDGRVYRRWAAVFMFENQYVRSLGSANRYLRRLEAGGCITRIVDKHEGNVYRLTMKLWLLMSRKSAYTLDLEEAKRDKTEAMTVYQKRETQMKTSGQTAR